MPPASKKERATLIKSYPHDPDNVLSMFLIFLWIGASLIFTLIMGAMVFTSNTNLRTGLIIIVVTLGVLPLPKSYNTKNPMHKLGFFLGDRIMNAAATYFGLSVYADSLQALKDATKKHCDPGKGGLIVALTPHDVLPYPIFAFNPALDVFGDSGFGKKGSLQGLMTGILFKIPYVRHLYVNSFLVHY